MNYIQLRQIWQNPNNDKFEIECNNAGKWKIDQRSEGVVLKGHDGEEMVYILFSGMQSGHTDVVMVFYSVDSPLHVEHMMVNPGEDVVSWINLKLIQRGV